MPAGAEAREAWAWWKVKKWALNIAHRLFNRYGDPRLCASARPADAAFAARWAADCCQPFLVSAPARAPRYRLYCRGEAVVQAAPARGSFGSGSQPSTPA